MTLKSNPITTLSAEQTIELRSLWNAVGERFQPHNDRIIKCKLSRCCAELTLREFYIVFIHIAIAEISPIPAWLHDIINANQG